MKVFKEQIAELADLSETCEYLQKRAVLKHNATFDRSTGRFPKRNELKSLAILDAPSYCPPEGTYRYRQLESPLAFNMPSYCPPKRTYRYRQPERRRPPIEQLRWERGTEMNSVHEVGIQ